VESLDALRSVCANAAAAGIPVSMALIHRVSISVSFQDPDGNMVEVFWATGRRETDRPYTDPITLDDLRLPEDELIERAGSSG
jgi:catechol-2,3-dioxygenase